MNSLKNKVEMIHSQVWITHSPTPIQNTYWLINLVNCWRSFLSHCHCVFVRTRYYFEQYIRTFHYRCHHAQTFGAMCRIYVHISPIPFIAEKSICLDKYKHLFADRRVSGPRCDLFVPLFPSINFCGMLFIQFMKFYSRNSCITIKSFEHWTV